MPARRPPTPQPGPASPPRSPARFALPPTPPATPIAIRSRRSPSSASIPPTRSSKCGRAAAGTPKCSRPISPTHGKLWVAPPAGRSAEAISAKLAGNAAYAKVGTAPVTAGQPSAVPAGSADVVLTFRNVHNWLMGNPPIADAVFAEAFRMLKPGGTLGVVDHRLPESADSARQQSSGYIKIATVRALAEKAGFRFVEASEVNANPKDTTDWPEGVWTLPPTYRRRTSTAPNMRRSARATG